MGIGSRLGPAGRPESVLGKAFIIGVLMLVLLVPLTMVHGLITERASRRNDVVADVSRTWSNPQVAGAIVLTVPYAVIWTDSQGKPNTTVYELRVLPETLTIDGRLTPEYRHRSVFEVPVYTTRLTMKGQFQRPDLQALRLGEESVRWEEATLTIGVGDLRGVNPGLTATWNGMALAATPALSSTPLAQQALEAPVPGLREARADLLLPFAIEMDLKGTHQIQFQPSGKTTTVRLASTWPHPSFVGAFLPDASTVTDAGFSAQWRLSHFGRGYPQAWRDPDMKSDTLAAAAQASRFTVSLVVPVDVYQQAERSAKYGALFILLTFLTFYLVELFQRVRLHPVQYLLVGAALCLFYLLLLSMSEHIGFGPAYGVAAAATIGVIAMYAGHVLGGRWQGVRTAFGLSLLYAFLYVLLQLEDYALLVGSVVLFLILASVMFITRRVNWYTLGREADAAPAPAPGQ